MNECRHGPSAACGLAAFALAASGWWGCSRAEPVRARADSSIRVELATVDRADYDAALAKLRGKVVLVDFWATWCLPCLEQLSHTVELADRDGDRGLAVVTLSMDGPENAEQVRAVLRDKGAGRLMNMISQPGGGPQAIDAFEIAGGALPHYKLYDRAGTLRRTFALNPTAEQQFTPADIDAAVAELLAQ